MLDLGCFLSSNTTALWALLKQKETSILNPVEGCGLRKTRCFNKFSMLDLCRFLSSSFTAACPERVEGKQSPSVWRRLPRSADPSLFSGQAPLAVTLS